MRYEVRPIGFVRSSRREVFDDNWDRESSVIELCDDVPDEALSGLDDFSHVEIIALAHEASDTPPAPWARHPRGNSEWPRVGIFSQRNKDRPNRLLLSCAAVVSVEGRLVHLAGLDLIDNTPILDIKPVFRWTGPRGEFRAASWSDELGTHYFSS